MTVIILMQMKPRCFEDLIHLISLDRPGVLNSGLADSYFQARISGNIEYLHSSLEPILKETLGVILYQEQIMQIAVDIAGFSWTDADKLRKSIGKKDPQLMSSLQSRFVDGCINNGMPEGTSEKLWNQIQYFGGYGFNKAHAAGYAKLTYQTAYLKAHHPLEYYASLISVKSDDDGVKQYILEARMRGIRILTPDINISTDKCVILDDNIILPLTLVSGLAEKACNAILTERANGDFASYDDFCNRMEKRVVNSRIRENLIKAGVFDNLHQKHELLEDGSADLLNMEREALGFYISGHPLDSFDYSDYTMHINEISELPLNCEFKTVGIVDSIKEITDRNGNQMAFITISDSTDSMEAVVFAGVYGGDIQEGSIIHIQGQLEQHEPLKAIAINYQIIEDTELAVDTFS